MIRAFFWIIFFWLYLLTTVPELIKVIIFNRLGKYKERDYIINDVVLRWAVKMVSMTGSTVRVTGQENVPLTGPLIFVSNHQGNFDIPILEGFVRRPKAFIAKIELKKVPLINIWMHYANCIFMDRRNKRQSLDAINQAVKKIEEGQCYVIFPEGTRSADGRLSNFKAGSFRLATASGAPIIPVTIKGSSKIMEKKKFSIHPSKVEVIISPLVETKGAGEKELADRIRQIIEDNLKTGECLL